jgi:glycosyltransferase involved in cell wall biosynthesis
VKYLFVHQNFPAQYLHFIRHLVKRGKDDIVFISLANQNQITGVRRAIYQVPRPPAENTYIDAQDFEAATLRGAAVAHTARNLRELGYTPDIIIGHHGWGELLNINDVFPGVPLLGYHEFYYHVDGVDVGFDPEFRMDASFFPRIRAKNAVNLIALNNPGHGQTPTAWQLSTYPDWAQKKISLLREGVDTDTCKPAPAARKAKFTIGDFTVEPKHKLLTYVARDLEPYRGFHVIMRALVHLQRERPDLRAVLVGGNGVSYGAKLVGGTWRDYMMRELGDQLDLSRIHFPGRVDYETYVRLLQRSDAHVYITYPFVASWSLREALACGCVVLGGDTDPVQEFVTDGENGLIVPSLDAEAVSRRVLDVLETPALARTLRGNARAYAERNLRLADYIENFDALVERVVKGQV